MDNISEKTSIQTWKINKKYHGFIQKDTKISSNVTREKQLFRGAHPVSLYGRSGGWGRATQGFFCWINATANSKTACMVRVITTTYLNIRHFLNVDLSKLYPLIKNLFRIKLKHVSFTRRLEFYPKNRAKLTHDGSILFIVQNLKTPFSQTPFQKCILKIERMYLIKDLLQDNDYLIKVHLKDVYFGKPLDKNSMRHIRLQWEGNLYDFLCLRFGMGPTFWFSQNF